ncbi:hypothetical protein PCANC_19440 [Puccinia coronata f. sp. avenae]|uniref:Tet-like 2OG-Fe(II) oxygenase domain-containing protein n=1 Tax=Puccinia coronata f. sp. avenae TaxID=200324 RepID=A0A2N5UF41_9BASI|nr:hypothetical protein PCANC_19440 [Puccinia coronata f. sp. avenae]
MSPSPTNETRAQTKKSPPKRHSSSTTIASHLAPASLPPQIKLPSGNGTQTGGMMWADGWRKSSDPGQLVGRFCSLPKMKDAILHAQYNPVLEAAGIQEASDFISFQLQNFAPGVFDSTRQLLINGNYPSMAHMEYPAPYTANDFASFLTFTMYNFFNQPHQDRDVNLWTLVIWIPIFSPKTCAEDDPILADEGFDMMGAQFTFREFQKWEVYLYWFFMPDV